VVDFESRREAFWAAHERRRPEAARALARPEIAKRASFSGGYGAAKAIANEYGEEEDDGRQVSLTDVEGGGTVDDGDGDTPPGDGPDPAATTDGDVTLPTGAGSAAGEPSPDDRAVADTARGDDDRDAGAGDDTDGTDTEPEQTTMGHFE
jgi:deoxyribodipyrimidine photo-lyase